MTVASTQQALFFLGLGAITGGAYFLALAKLVRLQVSQLSLSKVLPLHLLRLALMAAALWLVAQFGALPLLATLGGLFAARFAVQSLVRWD